MAPWSDRVHGPKAEMPQIPCFDRVVTFTSSTFSRASTETNNNLSHALTIKDRLFTMGDNGTPADGVAPGLVS